MKDLHVFVDKDGVEYISYPEVNNSFDYAGIIMISSLMPFIMMVALALTYTTNA